MDLLLEGNEGRRDPLTKTDIRDQMTSIMIVVWIPSNIEQKIEPIFDLF